jgi:DNA-directed RNA polymerase subunit K/omega
MNKDENSDNEYNNIDDDNDDLNNEDNDSDNIEEIFDDYDDDDKLDDDEINDTNYLSDDKTFIDINDGNNNINTNNVYLVGNDRISSNKLTRYEMVRILGERTKQLFTGAKPLIKNYKELSYEQIAEYELLNNMIPFKIKRPLPNNKFEIWTLDELFKDHLIHLLEH